MTNGTHPYQLIEDYLSGTLDKEEHTAIEERITQDNSFAKEIELHRSIQNALSDRDVLELEEILIKIRNTSKKDTQGGRIISLKRRRSILGAVAAILLLIVATYFIWDKKTDAPLADVFEPYPFYLANRSLDNEAAQQQLNQAAQSYEAEEFELALPVFESLLEQSPENMALQFYKAYCELELEQYQLAEQSFVVILENGDSAYVQPAEWYLVKVYLAKEEIAKAKNLLQKIVKERGDFSQPANQLLERL